MTEEEYNSQFRLDFVESQRTNSSDVGFKNVCFTYPERKQQVLKNISFNFLSGEKIAFVGPR